MGSTTSHWPIAQRRFQAASKMFVPSVGPGYRDTGIRPWNFQNTKERMHGKYYDRMWKAAMDLQPAAITLTSFNEWGEGTQIEPARPHTTRNGSRYEDYGEDSENFYMERTHFWSHKLKSGCISPSASEADEL